MIFDLVNVLWKKEKITFINRMYAYGHHCSYTNDHHKISNKKINTYMKMFFSYSYLNDFTGLAVAALIACIPTVINAIRKTIPPEIINIHQVKLILYAKL